MKTTTEGPWLHIPAADYEAHMEATGQSPALRGAFARIYAAVQPGRVLAALAVQAGFVLTSCVEVGTGEGKSLVVSTFRKAPPSGTRK